MNDDELLRGIARAARESRDETSDLAVAPFSSAAKSRFVDSIVAAKPAKQDALVRSIESAKAPKRGRVIPLSAYFAAPLAAAAALVLYLGAGRGPEDLPMYSVALSANVQAERSDAGVATEETVLQPAAFFEMVARPAQPTPNLVARATLERNGKSLPFRGAIEVSDEGAVRLSGAARDIFPETTGTYEVLVTIARRDTEKGARTVRGRVRFLAP